MIIDAKNKMVLIDRKSNLHILDKTDLDANSKFVERSTGKILSKKEVDFTPARSIDIFYFKDNGKYMLKDYFNGVPVFVEVR
jgi:hypothetical protein